MPQEMGRFSSAFSALQEIQLNTTLIPWRDLKRLLRHLPSLTVVEYGYNGLSNLYSTEGDPIEDQNTNSALRIINFDSNELTGWAEVVTALQIFPKYALSHCFFSTWWPVSIADTIACIAFSASYSPATG